VEPDSLAHRIDSAPLVEAWRRFVAAPGPTFTIPGHKRRAATLSPALARMLDADVPLFGGLDDGKLTHDRLRTAERLAADLWGADWARFSTGGATHPNQAFALAAGRPGQRVLVARTAHRSTLSGIVLAGLDPVWLPVRVDPRFGIPIGVDPEVVRSELAAHPDATALFLVEPSYLGAQSADLADVIATAHDAGLAVIVDQAWGAHFGFAAGYPDHALALGADAMVASAHKTLPAFSQAAYALARTDRFDPAWLDRCFDAGNTTSPAGAILASADASRAVLAHPDGAGLLATAATAVERARARLRAAGYVVPGPDDFAPRTFDASKLVVQTDAAGVDGLELERALLAIGIPVEMADRSTVVPLVGLLDDDETIGPLVDLLVAHPSTRRPHPPRPTAETTLPRAAMTPRDAFFSPHEPVPIGRAIGRVCAEVVAPYPPGVPVLVPGEVIAEAQLDALQRAVAAGTRIAYAADPSLETVSVVRDAGAA
jgi:lysine decarboxylase